MPRTFLVTGGAGYIGSNVIALLAARGDRAIAYDDLSSGRVERLSHLGVESTSNTFIESSLTVTLASAALLARLASFQVLVKVRARASFRSFSLRMD